MEAFPKDFRLEHSALEKWAWGKVSIVNKIHMQRGKAGFYAIPSRNNENIFVICRCCGRCLETLERKSAEEVLSWRDFEEACEVLSTIIRSKVHDLYTCKNIFGFPRGGLVFAVRLSHLTGLSLITSIEDVTNETLLVDDIADTGKTLSDAMGLTNAKHSVTWFYHRQSKVVPDVWLVEKKDKWIIFPWERPAII